MGMTQAELRRHLEAAKVDALIYAGQEPAPTSFEDMRLTNRPLHNGSVGLAEDAPVLDVVLNMFVSYDDDVSTRRFTPTIMRAVADELALIEVAPRDGGFAGEVHRVACRARNQLLAAEWLDDKLEAAERARKAKAVQS